MAFYYHMKCPACDTPRKVIFSEEISGKLQVKCPSCTVIMELQNKEEKERDKRSKALA